MATKKFFHKRKNKSIKKEQVMKSKTRRLRLTWKGLNETKR